LMAVSNAMNPRENQAVPSLHRGILPGPYARSHSTSLGLLQSGQTWIKISWPDFTGFQDLKLSTGPMRMFHQLAAALQQAGNQNHFHLTFWLVWNPSSRTHPRTTQSLWSFAHQDDPETTKLPGYAGLFSLPAYYRFGSLNQALDQF